MPEYFFSPITAVDEAGGSPQPRATTGRFASPYAERRGEAIALRLPQSLDQALRQTVGWQSKADNATLRAWVADAIAEKLARQQQDSLQQDSP